LFRHSKRWHFNGIYIHLTSQTPRESLEFQIALSNLKRAAARELDGVKRRFPGMKDDRPAAFMLGSVLLNPQLLIYNAAGEGLRCSSALFSASSAESRRGCSCAGLFGTPVRFPNPKALPRFGPNPRFRHENRSASQKFQ
jgi:hypothetical protein